MHICSVQVVRDSIMVCVRDSTCTDTAKHIIRNIRYICNYITDTCAADLTDAADTLTHVQRHCNYHMYRSQSYRPTA